MVLLGPGFVDIAVAHGAVSAFHADRAHIDMAQRHADHAHRRNGVDDLGQLHRAAVIVHARDNAIEHPARGRQDQPEQDQAAPEPELLASIEAMRRRRVTIAKAEADTAKFLAEYYGGGVNYRGLMGLGPVAKVIETLKLYEAAGVTDLCIRIAGTDQVAQMETFVRDIAPAFAQK